MQESDWPEVRRIYGEGISTGQATFEAEVPDWHRFDASRLTSHRLVAQAPDGGILGWAAVSAVSARPVYAGVVEHSIYVSAAARGRRIGSALLRALIASTEEDGVWTLQASVFPENAASLKLHLAHGFREVGRREKIARMSYGPAAGQWRDTVLIERRAARCTARPTERQTQEDAMPDAPTTEERLRAMLDSIRTAAANTRQVMDSSGDEDWVQDGESDAEYVRSIQRDTITRLDAAARDIEALLAERGAG